MDILITGGAGFIGSNLSQYHLDKNDKVTIIDNLITGSKNNIQDLIKNKNFRFIHADIIGFDFNGLSAYNIVYHLASPASPIQYKKYPLETLMVNSYGTKRLLDFFLKSKSNTFILASTSEVYGDPLIHPQTETYWGNVNPRGTRSCYDEAKRFAEALAATYCNKYHANIKTARIFNTYGPHMEKEDGRVVSNFIMQALTNSPITIYGDGKQTRSFCYVSDLIQGLNFLANTDNLKGEVINLGNPEEKTINELATIIKNMVNSQSKIVFEKICADDPKKRKPDITKARKLLNWQPKINLDEGLKKTINYFRERFL